MCLSLLLYTCNTKKSNDEILKIIPINHSTFIIEYNNDVIYIDPVGGKETFEHQKAPTMIVVTDIHSDHFNNETLLSITSEKTKIVTPKVVSEKISHKLKTNTIILNNNDSTSLNSIQIKAIPMYHLREEAKDFHPKGRGNGYVLSLGEKRIYISGDTEDIPEMRALKNIDIAFLCMNLPWTMSIEKAADAVLDFKPKEVYPYHYKGTNGMSNINQFKSLINKENNSIKVQLREWY